jgi:two-component system OmpR family response regulator
MGYCRIIESDMNVLSVLPRLKLQKKLEGALMLAQVTMQNAASEYECMQLSRLGGYEGFLVDSDALRFRDTVLLVEMLRQENSNAAVFVFARYLDLEQRLKLLHAGADNCIIGPFFGSEVVTRLGLSIRLRQAATPAALTVLRACDLELDLVLRTVRRSGKPIALRPKEFLLLEYLMRNVNRPVSRAMILERVWGSSFDGLANVVEVYISALRSKIDRDFEPKLIQTLRGNGYTFVCSNGLRDS